ncbi:MAG: phosphoenolpyruvate--protein phosphotransferase [Candidatus Promineifilaceae bacterium]
MVGIVIVSHSAKLAEGVRDLADQMVQGKVALATAGGIDDPEQPIGTDAMKVLEAIMAVYNEDGVVVFMDLGSALLSTEMALEFLDPAQREHVHLSAAPLVEGVMAAAVQASIGGSPQQIIAEAQDSLLFKAEQLGESPPSTTPDNEGVSPLEALPETEQITLIIPNKLGLHARPAALFVATAGRFTADIWVTKGDRRANAKSINQIALLGARQGDEIRIEAAGADASRALAALQELAADNFGDRDDSDVASAAAPAGTVSEPPAAGGSGIVSGIAASPGIAIGPVVLYRPTLPEIEIVAVDNYEGEWVRLEKAIAEAIEEIETLRATAVKQAGPSEAAIFEAHALMLRDPDLMQKVQQLLVEQLINAEAAWDQAIAATAAGYRALDDVYMQGRAADVEDVGGRVLRKLMALEPPSLDFEQPSILVAEDLSPSDTARMDPAYVLGICTELGGATSHSAILARGLGIPAVVGLGSAVWQVQAGQIVALNGNKGHLWLHPSETELTQLWAEQAQWQRAQAEARQESAQPAVTADGTRIEVAANIGGPHDTTVALQYGAEGVGLFRTEFLFLDRETAPSEEEQYLAYRQAAEVMGERPLIIRTLDVGGDKPLPYLDLGEEDNPFLGYRGIRFCLDHPEIFMPQLRAILRAGAGLNVRMMFPMIGTLRELREAERQVAMAAAELSEERLAHDDAMALGIMIEVPSAVAVADRLAREVDFFSIGTNDLTQYTMAADRGNPTVAGLAQALNPAVLRLIKQTVDAAHAAGIWVGMCGELAGNALATKLLVGLGLDELSMSAPAIPAVKAAIRTITLPEARAMAAEVLQLDSAEAVTDHLAAQQ